MNLTHLVSFINTMSIQIPAVTSVELWTKALTGVGAAIAAGNQLVNGHCALLVKAKIITMTSANLAGASLMLATPQEKNIVRTINNKASPKRLTKNVSTPLLKLIQFW